MNEQDQALVAKLNALPPSYRPRCKVEIARPPHCVVEVALSAVAREEQEARVSESIQTYYQECRSRGAFVGD